MGRNSTICTIMVVIATLASTAALAETKYDSGVTDTEIKLGQTAPYSGPVSSYGTFGKALLAYFAMINEQGGVNGRKIKLITVDDGFSPSKTVEQTRKLVESDGIFFDFASVGTAPNLAIRQYLNEKSRNSSCKAAFRVGTIRRISPGPCPELPNYATEVRAFAHYILETKPNARIAILYQNDDFGKEYLNGMRVRLGAQADKMLVNTQSFELSDPTVNSQMISLQGSALTVLLIVATQKQTVQRFRKAYELDWHPLKFIAFPAVSVTRTYIPGRRRCLKGRDLIVGICRPVGPGSTERSRRSSLSRGTWMEKYYPAGDKLDGLNGAAYFEAQLVVDVLKRCDDLLTRQNVMKQAASFHQFTAGMLRSGITVNTNPEDYNMFRKLQLIEFDGKYLAPLGAPISD